MTISEAFHSLCLVPACFLYASHPLPLSGRVRSSLETWNWRNSHSSPGSGMIAEWMPHEYSVCHTYLYCHVKDVEIPAHVPPRWYIRGLPYLYVRHATIMRWQTRSSRLTNNWAAYEQGKMDKSHTFMTRRYANVGAYEWWMCYRQKAFISFIKKNLMRSYEKF